MSWIWLFLDTVLGPLWGCWLLAILRSWVQPVSPVFCGTTSTHSDTQTMDNRCETTSASVNETIDGIQEGYD